MPMPDNNKLAALLTAMPALDDALSEAKAAFLRECDEYDSVVPKLSDQVRQRAAQYDEEGRAQRLRDAVTALTGEMTRLKQATAPLLGSIAQLSMAIQVAGLSQATRFIQEVIDQPLDTRASHTAAVRSAVEGLMMGREALRALRAATALLRAQREMLAAFVADKLSWNTKRFLSALKDTVKEKAEDGAFDLALDAVLKAAEWTPAAPIAKALGFGVDLTRKVVAMNDNLTPVGSDLESMMLFEETVARMRAAADVDLALIRAATDGLITVKR